MFNNNNNYLPDLNHYPPAGQAAVGPPAAPAPLDSTLMINGSGPRQNLFRFLSPTQGTSVPTWTPVSTAVGVASAPGVGASWQHWVPTSLPWANANVPHFSGQNVLSQALPVYTAGMVMTPQTTSVQLSPRPSVMSHHHKRRHMPQTAETNEGPSAKRYLSETMAASFRQLQISPTTEGVVDSSTNGDSNQGFSFAKFNTDGGWQHFQDVEKRLEEDIDTDELTLRRDNVRQFTAGASPDEALQKAAEGTGGEIEVLHLPDQLQWQVKRPGHILPDSIIKSITNPCTDLVLWSPPEDILSEDPSVSLPSQDSRRNGYKHSQSDGTSGPSSQSMTSPIQPVMHSEAPFNPAVNNMDMFDSIDDDMDL